MQHSKQPRIELAKARATIEAMRKSKPQDEFEENWKMFLHRLEHIWNKAEHHFEFRTPNNRIVRDSGNTARMRPHLSGSSRALGADRRDLANRINN
jgi:hypothetical protein